MGNIYNGEGREGITVLAICMFLMAEWDCYLGTRRFRLLLFLSLNAGYQKRLAGGAIGGGSLNKKQRLQRRLHSLIQN